MNFKQGIRDGIPIGLGYAAVSFAFGILAVDKDLTVSEAVLISFTNLTSAGQFAGLTIIAELGTLVTDRSCYPATEYHSFDGRICRRRNYCRTWNIS